MPLFSYLFSLEGQFSLEMLAAFSNFIASGLGSVSMAFSESEGQEQKQE